MACAVVLGMLSGSAGARDWFVDRGHAQASNTNAGTEALPFKTIQAPANVAKPGDAVWVKQGVYEGQTRITTSGTIHAPITVSAWKDDRVVIGSVLRDLPHKATIPVGRKADTLFFLHAAAWAGDGERFRYVVHYQDGKQVTLVVDATKLADWIADPVRRFRKEQGTFTTAAETVPTPQFRQGTVYRMEWSAPGDRRPVTIDRIEFVGNPACVPVLLGVTGVVEW